MKKCYIIYYIIDGHCGRISEVKGFSTNPAVINAYIRSRYKMDTDVELAVEVIEGRDDVELGEKLNDLGVTSDDKLELEISHIDKRKCTAMSESLDVEIMEMNFYTDILQRITDAIFRLELLCPVLRDNKELLRLLIYLKHRYAMLAILTNEGSGSLEEVLSESLPKEFEGFNTVGFFDIIDKVGFIEDYFKRN